MNEYGIMNCGLRVAVTEHLSGEPFFSSCKQAAEKLKFAAVFVEMITHKSLIL